MHTLLPSTLSGHTAAERGHDITLRGHGTTMSNHRGCQQPWTINHRPSKCKRLLEGKHVQIRLHVRTGNKSSSGSPKRSANGAGSKVDVSSKVIVG